MFSKLITFKTLIAIFAMGVFASDKSDNNQDKTLFLKPLSNLNDEELDKFILGRSFFTIPWVEAPSATTARDGLGALFNAHSCISCHPSNGRGNLLNKDGSVSPSLVAKLSLNEKIKDKNKTFIPEPNYGNQIATNSVFGVSYEGKTKIRFKEKKVIFSNKEEIFLQQPNYILENLQYGKLHKNSVISYRLAPSLNGIGLIDLISNEDILKNVDEFDKNSDGISGKANFVYSNISKKMELGKYGWKANISTIKEQIADASFNDMGLTTTIFPYENCTKTQIKCNETPKAKDKIDLTDERLEAMDFYLKNRKSFEVKKDESYEKGLEIFEKISCVKCHISEFTIKNRVKISPFSDFLLHDMGDGLSDGRVEFSAEKNEFRTPPLWGLSLHEKINNQKPALLHDGRARDFQEAILWHGGEAEKSKNEYMNLPKIQREELIKFLEEL